MELKDKVVFITGSTQGIGAAMAVAFVRQGAKLIVNGRKQELPKDLKDALDKENADYRYLSADLAQDNLEEIGKTAWNLFGKIDVLINNAGQAKDKMFIGMHDADFEEVLNLDLKVPFFLSKAIMKRMNKERSGVIINLSSVVGLHGNVGQANYAAAKAGLIGFTKSIAREGALRNIRVNAIAPGYMSTNNTAQLRSDSDRSEAIIDRIPAGRWGTPDDMKGAVVFLASAASDYVNGFTLAVDGGWLAR